MNHTKPPPRIYKTVKSSVTAYDAATRYGLPVNRSGMCRCPFHDDHVPSMKVDRRYHCFGCGADGDVISLTAKLFHINNYEAAKKIAEDFDICKVKKKDPRRMKTPFSPETVRVNRKIERVLNRFFHSLVTYKRTLENWKDRYAPSSPEEKWDVRFIEALQNLTTVEYIIDCFLEADFKDQILILIEYGKKVFSFHEQKTGTDSGTDGTAAGTPRDGNRSRRRTCMDRRQDDQ
ncbi:MAG: DNA primase [Lachnospiraceae bacterium]|nr:DNA primase [Lachnospiraceae bacterium]